jgi:hypothetical protein
MNRSRSIVPGQRPRWIPCALLTLASVPHVACLDRPVASVVPQTQSAVQHVAVAERLDKVDLLVVVDNSNSMAANQANLMAQLGPMIDELVAPRCRSVANPTAPLHVCDSSNPDDVPSSAPVRDLHVGVISSDLGTAGYQVCNRNVPGDVGDDGLLNPIRYGAAMQSHLPWAAGSGAPSDFRPASCGMDAMRFPSFITFCSNEADASCDVAGQSASTRDPRLFSDWFKCNAGLFINGCGLEQPLEAAWRALVHHDARSTAGNTARNAGFLRDDALLAVIVLSDEEDGSTRVCDRDEGFSSQGNGACVDARTVFDSTSALWGATGLNERFYLYRPGSAQDPTFSLDRYYNRSEPTVANRWTRDLLSLKPGHPERIVFAAITGVPLAVPTRVAAAGQEPVTDWDALLGAPSAGGSDDFVGRNSSTAIEGTQAAAGSYSMRGGALTPGCDHVAPACRREGSLPDPNNACAATLQRPGQYMAFPSRRIVEMARRFDESPSCNGQPCRNGIVTSICSQDYRGAMATILGKIKQRLNTPCLQRALDTSTDSTGSVRATCTVREVQPEGVTECDASRGRLAVTSGGAAGEGRVLCEIAQVPTHAEGSAQAMSPVDPSQPGWFYDRRANPERAECRGSVQFTASGAPRAGARILLECVQRVEQPGGSTAASGAAR